MNRILFIVLILFLAVFLGLQLNHDPGYVLIAVNQWTIETTLWFAVFMLLAGFAFAHGLLLLLAHLGQVPTNYHTWKTRHKTKIAQDILVCQKSSAACRRVRSLLGELRIHLAS